TDLDVFPEHENPGAAAKLEAAIFPFQLPLALGREEMDLLLSQRGVSRAELLAAFRTGRTETDPQTDALSATSDPGIALAYLNLTPAEEAAILNRDDDPALYWGLQPEGSQTLPRPESPQVPISGTWLEVLSEVSIFLHRSQLSYAELLELVDIEYLVSEGGGISIVAEPEYQLNCNYHRFRLDNLYESLAQRINVFLRLRRMLGWEMVE